MFGNNPIETRMSGGGHTFVTQNIKREHGVRTIVIDPRFSETSVALGDEWVPIRPATDAALIAGMIYVMVEENLHDQAFLDKYRLGFYEDHMPEGAPKNASHRAYLEGKGAVAVGFVAYKMADDDALARPVPLAAWVTAGFVVLLVAELMGRSLHYNSQQLIGIG